MKKSISLILAMVMALTLLAGCGSKRMTPPRRTAPQPWRS